jgi:hypothetical protein
VADVLDRNFRWYSTSHDASSRPLAAISACRSQKARARPRDEIADSFMQNIRRSACARPRRPLGSACTIDIAPHTTAVG